MSPPTQRSAAAAITPSGAPPMPISTSTPLSSKQVATAAGDVAVFDQPDAGAGRAHLGDQLLVAIAVEDDHRQLARPRGPSPSAMRLQVLGRALAQSRWRPWRAGPTAIFSM